MRTSLIAAVTALTATALHTPADACGPYGPRAFLVSSHSGHDGVERWVTRSFVQIGGAAPANAAWKMLAPGSYDSSQFADAPDLDAPMTLTLVGPSGTKVVESSARVYLRPAWQGATGAALEVDSKVDAVVALAGRHTDATWIALDNSNATRADATWLTAHGTPAQNPELVSRNQVHGTDLQVLTVYADGNATTFVRERGNLIAQFDGSPLGALSTRGAKYLLVSREGRVTPELI